MAANDHWRGWSRAAISDEKQASKLFFYISTVHYSTYQIQYYKYESVEQNWSQNGSQLNKTESMVK
jgi:hypothetical protein